MDRHGLAVVLGFAGTSRDVAGLMDARSTGAHYFWVWLGGWFHRCWNLFGSNIDTHAATENRLRFPEGMNGFRKLERLRPLSP